MSGFWDQFNYKNIHNFDFWLNLAILKPRIYSKSQNTQSLGYEFAKKSRLRRWCKFLSENHKSHGFVTRGWRRLDAAYLSCCGSSGSRHHQTMILCTRVAEWRVIVEHQSK